MCFCLPLGRHTVNVVPILIGRVSGLGFAVIVAGGIGETGVVRSNADSRPLLSGTGIINRCKAGATVERIRANTCHAIGNGGACKTVATRERTITNACHAIGNGDAGKARATIECTTANACHAIAKGDAGKALATFERRSANAGHAVGNGDAGKVFTIIERTVQDISSGNGNCFQACGNVIGTRGCTAYTTAIIVLRGRNTAGITAGSKDVAKGILVGIATCFFGATYKR